MRIKSYDYFSPVSVIKVSVVVTYRLSFYVPWAKAQMSVGVLHFIHDLKVVAINCNLILSGIPPKAGNPTYRFSPASGMNHAVHTSGGIFNILWRGGQVEFEQKKSSRPRILRGTG
jgi:hypothetical protein